MKKFKLIALIVAAIMVCQSFAVATVFAANDAQKSQAQIRDEALSFLETVGAITIDKEWSEAGLIGSVTRSYAATVFANIIRGGKTAHYPDIEPVLADVPAGQGNADNIYLAVAYDVIPAIEGNFNEKGLFTFGDLKYAITSLLGYNNYVKATGLGEAELTKLIAQEGIFDGVEYRATMPLTKAEFAIVLKNALHAEMIYQLSYSSSSFEFDRNTGVTMMEEYFGVAEYEGVITANPYSSLSNSKGCQDDEVILGEMRCKINGTNAADYIGVKVSAYVKEAENNNEISKILIIDYAPGTKVLSIGAEYINPNASGFRLTSIAYEDANGRSKRASVTGTANYFYNGVATDLTVADFRINSGSVTLISNNGKASYDVIKIDTYENYVVDSVDSDDVVHCKLGSGHTLNLNEDDVNFIDIRRTNNRVVKVNQIKEGNILSVYKSKDGSYVKAIVSNTVIDGEIVGVDESGIRTVFTVDAGGDSANDIPAYFMGSTWEADYRYTFDYPEKNFEGTFYLDAYGYLAYAEVGPVLVQYGYVTGVKTGSGLDTTVTLQLVDQNGVTRELTVPEKGVRTNNFISETVSNGKYSPETVSEIINRTSSVTSYPTDMYRLVRFNANSKNMLTKLDFAMDVCGTVDDASNKYVVNTNKTAPDTFYDEERFTFNHYTEASTRYLSATRMFSSSQGGAMYGINTNTVVFTLDRRNSTVSPDDVAVIKGSQVPNDDKFSKIYLYDVDKALGANAAIITVDTSSVGALSGICIYDSMYSVVNADTEENETRMKYWRTGKLQELVLSDNFTMPEGGLTKGDAMFVYRDYYGELVKVDNLKSKLWNNIGHEICGDENLGRNNESNSYNYANSGYLVGKTNERFAIDKAEGDSYNVKTFALSSPSVYLIENDGGKTTITVTSVSALAPSVENSEDSKIIYGGNQARISDVVIYR